MWQTIKASSQKNRTLYVLEAITLVLLLITGIRFRQSPLRMLPLCISLAVMFLQANVNRYSFLLGGLNSLAYATVYFTMGLPSQAVYALLVSFPLQIASFVNWHKKADGASTHLLRMSPVWRLLTLLGLLAAFGGLILVYLFLFDYPTAAELLIMILDNAVTLLGIVATVLMMLRFVEYAPLQITSLLCSLTIYCTMLREDPAQITFIIYTVYAGICTLIAIRNMRRRYRAQQENK